MRETRHQSISEILETSSPEQKIVWEQIMLLTGENCAVRKLSYTGALAGSEFATYQNTKLYLAYNIEVSGIGTLLINAAICYFANELNAWFFGAQNNAVIYNTTAAAITYFPNNVSIKNLYFSRMFFAAGYTYLNFQGYRIIY